MLNVSNLRLILPIEYGFGLLLMNIFIYLGLLAMLFGVFFLFNLSKIKSLNEFKKFFVLNFIIMLVFFNLLSLAGMPPLLGFVGKFLVIIFLLFKNQYTIFFIFSLINIFMIYFYIQNLRFMVNKSTSGYLKNLNGQLTFDLNFLVLLVFLSFLNVFGIIFFSDFLIVINSLASFIFLG